MTPNIRKRRAFALCYQAMQLDEELTDGALARIVIRDFVGTQAERDEVFEDCIAVRDAIEELAL